MIWLASTVSGIGVVTLILFSYSGLGRALLGSAAACNPWRTVSAQYVMGALLYLALFGAAAQIGVPFGVFVGLLGALGIAGLFLIARAGACDLKDIQVRLGLAASLALLLGASTRVSGDPLVGDLWNYGSGTAAMFHNDWFEPRPWAKFIGTTRGPAVGFQWLMGGLGQGVGTQALYGIGVWQLLLSVVFVADTLVGTASLLGRMVIALGSLGAFNVAMLLIGGQINQPFGLVVATCLVWFCRHVQERRSRLLMMVLSGFVLMGAYPEFLLALPLYLACAAAMHAGSLRQLITETSAFVAGVLLVQVVSRLENLKYLVGQMSNRPGWGPLPREPSNPLELWELILLQGAPTGWLVLAVVPVVIYAVDSLPSRRVDHPLPGARILGAAMVAMLGMSIVWSWAALTASNINYSSFKVAGWLGPALLMFAWLAAQGAPPGLRRPFVVGILAVAVVRVIGFRDYAGQHLGEGSRVGLWEPERVHAEGLPPDDARCLILAPGPHHAVVARTEAESSAVFRGCRVQPTEFSGLSALYKASPPMVWKTGETHSYVVYLRNLGPETWHPSGVNAVMLATRFVPIHSASSSSTLSTLPLTMVPIGHIGVPVTIQAPEISGEYFLEHQIIRPPNELSPQSMRLRVRVV